MSDLHRAREQYYDAVPPTTGLPKTDHQALGRCWCGSTHSVDEAVSLNDPAMTLRESIEEHVPDGFRDEDGVWHDGPHQRDALAQLDAIEARIANVENVLARLAEAERVIALCASDTTAADLAQEVEFLKAELAQEKEGR